MLRRRAAGLALLAAGLGCERSAPVGPLLFVRDAGGRSVVMYLPAGPPGAPAAPIALPVPGDQAFAAPAGPPGAPLLAIGSTEQADGHEERLWIVDLEAGPRALGRGYARLRSPAWAADGQSVVVEASSAGFSDLVQVSVVDGAHKPLTDLPSGAFTPAVAPDGTVAFVSGPDGDLDLYTVPVGGGPIRALLRAPGEDLNPTWSPDGRRLAWISSRGAGLGLSVMERGSWAPRALWTPTGQGEAVPDQGLGWSPDGALIALPISEKDRVCIAILDASSGQVLRGPGSARPCPPGVEQGVAWAPDGRGVLTSRSLAGDADLVLIPVREGEEQRWMAGPGVDWLPRWLSDGAPR